jgi:hypothetical protein
MIILPILITLFCGTYVYSNGQDHRQPVKTSRELYEEAKDGGRSSLTIDNDWGY